MTAQPIQLKIKRVDNAGSADNADNADNADKNVPLPTYAYFGDAGLDLRAAQPCVLEPGERALIPTGLALAIPEGYAGFVLPRSGLALRSGLSMVNAPGLIDSHYRGEVKVIAINLDRHEPIVIAKGDRIAQLVLMAVPPVQIEEVDRLDETQRGSGGFGSSGV
jgi:dUTP pyrophosphatase